MDMNRALFVRKEDRDPQWLEIDAEGQVLGRLATMITERLRGKHKACYTPHTDCGDYVVVVNAEKVILTGNKWSDKIYARYSGWMGGLKEVAAQDLVKKHPTHLIELAVKGMFPKNKLGRQQIKKLKVYAGPSHPHKAQCGAKAAKAA